MNLFFSIVISCENASEKRFYEVLRIRCTFSLKIQFFIMFDLTLAQILRYFLNFRKCAYESLLQHRNILRKCEKLFYEVFVDPMHLFIKDSIFHNVRTNFGPDFEIFSQFQEMHLWIPFLHHNILRKCRKQLWGYADPMHLFIKDSIFHNVWPNLGPRFWDIFSISGNALMNLFFSIVISCEKAKNDFCEVLWIRCTFSLKIQFFIMFGLTLGPDFEIFSQFQEMRLWITSLHRNILRKSEKQFWRFCGSDAPFH